MNEQYKYRIRPYASNPIDRVLIHKETAYYAWIREPMHTSGRYLNAMAYGLAQKTLKDGSLFDTFAEAKEAYVAQCRRRLEVAEAKVVRLREDLEDAEALEEPGRRRTDV